ncbi:hypothetical protein Mgra_00005417, partial [Meloidogyne graminicola]
VHICSCLDSEHCFIKTDFYLNKTCREECSHWLNIYNNENKQNNLLELTNCFWKEGKQDNEFGTFNKAIKLTNCSNTERHFISSQYNYNQLIEKLIGNTSIEYKDNLPHQGAFIRRARATFVVFRNFQKCMNNCAKLYLSECFKKSECAISLSNDYLNSLKIYNECTNQNIYQDAHNSCRCLIKNYRARKLIGICSLLLNAHLMHSLH